MIPRPAILDRPLKTTKGTIVPKINILNDPDSANKKKKSKSKEVNIIEHYFNDDEYKDFGINDPIIC